MFFSTLCPACGAALRLDTQYRGQEAQCGRCGRVFLAVPADPPAAPEPPDRRRDEPDDDAPPRRRPPPPDGSGAATAALALGIVGLFTWWFPPVGLVVGAVAVALGANGLQSRGRPQAVVGIVFGLVGLIFSLGCGTLAGVYFLRDKPGGDGPNPPPFVNQFP